jgi:hypothetical protein
MQTAAVVSAAPIRDAILFMTTPTGGPVRNPRRWRGNSSSAPDTCCRYGLTTRSDVKPGGIERGAVITPIGLNAFIVLTSPRGSSASRTDPHPTGSHIQSIEAECSLRNGPRDRKRTGSLSPGTVPVDRAWRGTWPVTKAAIGIATARPPSLQPVAIAKWLYQQPP